MNQIMIDPAWAWSAYEPTEQNPWDLRGAAHLFRRAGFAATRAELEQAVSREPADVVAELVAAGEPESYQAQIDSLIKASLATGNVKRLSAQWVYRMLTTPAQLQEKMTLFWHGHFATSAAKVEDAELMQQQNELLRQYALGDFSQLLLEISRDPAMLIYLDSVTNRKAHPNENYAREIMELFALGEGNYSEEDIRELARCFTGWEIKRDKFRFNRYQHDSGSKTVLGKTGNLTGEQGVAIVAGQATAPQFIVRKLIRFFVMDEPEAWEALINPLADELRKNELVIAPTLQRILSSNLFFSSHARARKVRSPVEFGIGFLRALTGSTDAYQLADALEQLGQGLYYPPSVKGWDGGRTWINSSTLLGRANLIRRLVDGGKTRFGKQNIAEYLQAQGVGSTAELIDWLETSLFAVAIPAAAKQRLVDLDAQSQRDPVRRTRDAVHLLCTLPEFQLA
jgi:uncharacterized protein (DUF1800 family)